MVVAEHSSPAGKGIDVELPGVLKFTHLMQAICEVMSGVQGIGMVLTEHPPTSSEGVIGELTSLTVRANVDEKTDEDIGNP